MLAHIRENDGKEQLLIDHLNNAAAISRQSQKSMSLQSIVELIAMLHDLGKGTADFKSYLKASQLGETKTVFHHNHAPSGAIFAYERWCREDSTGLQKRTAQMIALCIYGHHSGLMDCVGEDQEQRFLTCMESSKEQLRYREACDFFLRNICTEEKLDALFSEACKEVNAFLTAWQGNKSLGYSFLTRLLLSILVDADRWDSACFEYGEDPLPEKKYPDWGALSAKYLEYAEKKFIGESQLDKVRNEISERCREAASGKTGIYRLTVPTGGGKTFASLQFALRHAEKNGKSRIFYVIPFNTILDQNADDIRAALDDYEGILEHHGNIMTGEESSDEQLRYRRLTERWDSDIILTSMVQFMNALFRKENSNVRRMYRLCNAVIIFDEIQALPRKCKTLFEAAVAFLTECCNSTVVLCSATQLKLNAPQMTEIMGTETEIETLYRSLKRVAYIPQLQSKMKNQEAAERLRDLLAEHRSVLMIVNTKAAARDIYTKTCDILRESNTLISVDSAITEEQEIRKRAAEAGPDEILCVHLSTLLCPAHRKIYIRWLKNWSGRAFCVSTALIEAGINISFPAAVRSLASLPSIIQAAGRCNRNCEQEKGLVYIWDLEEENLRMLPDIQNGAECTRNLWEEIQHTETKATFDCLTEPAGINDYFLQEELYTKAQEAYPRKKKPGTLVDLLSENKSTLKGMKPPYPLRQSFETAGSEFCVIEDRTKPILVPYGEGKNLIVQLNGNCTMEDQQRLLRKAQQYSVNVYDNMFRRLAAENALYPVGDSGAFALREEYYHSEYGVAADNNELETIIL